MAESFWFTILGGFLAGGFGLLLFFIQKFVEKRANEQNILFQIYSMLEDRRIDGRSSEGFFENLNRYRDIENSSFLLKDKNIRKKIFLYARSMISKSVDNAPEREVLLKEIRQKLNRRLAKDIESNLSNKWII